MQTSRARILAIINTSITTAIQWPSPTIALSDTLITEVDQFPEVTMEQCQTNDVADSLMGARRFHVDCVECINAYILLTPNFQVLMTENCEFLQVFSC